MIPRLQRFYGEPGKDEDWWTCPEWKFHSYLTMMPRLQAEESLAFMTDLAAGTGAMEETPQREYRRQQVRNANGGRQQRGEKATRASLEAMGIQVIGGD